MTAVSSPPPRALATGSVGRAPSAAPSAARGPSDRPLLATVAGRLLEVVVVSIEGIRARIQRGATH